jgi:hypothetical protein
VSEVKSKALLQEEMIMQQWQDFEIITEVTGPTYRVMRAELLKDRANMLKRLDSFQDVRHWKTIITAAILRGWLEHEQLYAIISKSLDSEQIEDALAKITGMDGIYRKYVLFAEENQKAVLPFCWEALLKFSAEWEDWQTIAAIRMIGTVPDRRSVRPLLWFIKTTEEYHLADEAARALARIDDEETRELLRAARDEHARIADLLGEALEKDEE